SFRNGMVAFKRDTIYATNPHTITVGTTWGIFPGVWVRADKATRNHEVIHAMQSLQGDSPEPHLPFLTYTPSDHRKRLIRFEHLDIGMLNMLEGRLSGREQYQDRWTEIEAYRLAQQKAPNVP
ncbi:MAG TPA: hypothetical protein VHU41_10100, partial [Thermoanaerobaculia bacterium]|nr:hypothetical protein [Thermoanaerobaculia bacterium]